MYSSIFQNVYSQYHHWIFYEGKDPRAKDYFLMSSPIPTFLILVSYLYFIYNLGPKIMKNRPAYNLKTIIICYNIYQVMQNFYGVYYASLYWWNGLSWFCSPVDYHNFHHLSHTHMYFINKIVDLFDTIFFVLRKKPQQVTILHVTHHVGMVAVCWFVTAFVGGGMGIIYALANCTVHTIMYSYYLLTIWKPEYQKSIWWKKHITQLQLVQFVFIVVTFGQLLLFRPSCAYPKSYATVFMLSASLMLVMFGNFYYQTYIKPTERKIK